MFALAKEPRNCFRTESQYGSLELETVYLIGKSLLAISAMATILHPRQVASTVLSLRIDQHVQRRTNLVCEGQLFERNFDQGFLRMMLSELTLDIK